MYLSIYLSIYLSDCLFVRSVSIRLHYDWIQYLRVSGGIIVSAHIIITPMKTSNRHRPYINKSHLHKSISNGDNVHVFFYLEGKLINFHIQEICKHELLYVCTEFWNVLKSSLALWGEGVRWEIDSREGGVYLHRWENACEYTMYTIYKIVHIYIYYICIYMYM